ncbi:uncharacterized protein si:dkey-30e9.6 [Tachysurus vachellii]|uniref:uncharacterized protein si:dkey-30e9.6 n=1 Tax=Tachysurus vachellii TaxID=175792 RepID=UPI00296B2B9F|nr:uncharacterized protein si:dkey-30e9.6 [Tachysurus vachellii]
MGLSICKYVKGPWNLEPIPRRNKVGDTPYMDLVHKVSVTEIKDSERSFTFNRKLLFTASQNVITSRSRIHKLLLPKAADRHRDLWEIKPPDFSPKLYCTLNLPRIKKKTLDSAILKEGLEELSQSLDIMPPVMESKQEKNRNIPVFVKSYKPPALLDLQLQFVKFGQFPRDPYKNPKPHNFRPCDENLPDMVTSIARDPGNLNLKTPLLGETIQPESYSPKEETARKIITFKPAEPKWDAQLMLPKSPWPPMSATYTRHRRRRGEYSAFMDRVEEKLSRSWMK